jgi:hypothetical protein
LENGCKIGAGCSVGRCGHTFKGVTPKMPNHKEQLLYASIQPQEKWNDFPNPHLPEGLSSSIYMFWKEFELNPSRNGLIYQ